MNTEDAAERRGLRAAIAERLLAAAPDAARTIGWDALDCAPPWLSLPQPELALFERRVGALPCVPALRLWIDRPRLDAARDALGASFLKAVIAHPVAPGTPVPDELPSTTADRVSTVLQRTGAAVLLASLPDGALQRAGAAMLAPPAELAITPGMALELVACAQAMVPEGETQ